MFLLEYKVRDLPVLGTCESCRKSTSRQRMPPMPCIVRARSLGPWTINSIISENAAVSVWSCPPAAFWLRNEGGWGLA